MCGGNPTAARLAGINVRRVNSILMVNCGFLSAMGGCVLAARLRTVSSGAVIGSDLDSITACCLGGIAFMGGEGNMLGALLGILLLTAFKNGRTIVGFSTYWQVVAGGVLLIVALSVDYISTKSRMRALEKLAFAKAN
jgi:ribose transport system permease protein